MEKVEQPSLNTNVHILQLQTFLKHLPDNKKMLMYWFIPGSLLFLAEMFPDVFSGDGKGSGRIFDS